MKRKTTILLAAAFLLAVVAASCKKDDPTPVQPASTDTTTPVDTVPPTDALAPYIGTYDVLFVYDSVYTNGYWFPNKPPYPHYDSDSGFLCITRTGNDSVVNFRCCVVFTASGTPDTMDKYVTTAVLRDSVLQPLQHTYTNESGISYDITYSPVTPTAQGLVFQTEQYFTYVGNSFGYKITSTCTRRPE